MEEKQEFLTAQELAQRWKVTLATVRQMTEDGRLPSVRPTGRRLVRYRVRDIESLEQLYHRPASLIRGGGERKRRDV